MTKVALGDANAVMQPCRLKNLPMYTMLCGWSMKISRRTSL
jgi:hypothetical protein